MTTTPINILIVDDEPKNLTVLETVLDDSGYRLVRAESADEALLALVAEEFGLLILDIRMPNMTGLELAQMVKQRKKTARIPIIFLTAYYNEDQHVLEGYEAGAVDYLHKPVNPAMLRSKVAVFAELHRASREIEVANQALVAEVAERRRAEENLAALNEILEQRVAERTLALSDSKHFLQRVTEVTPGGLHVFDVRERRNVFVNRSIASMLGYQANEAQAIESEVAPDWMHCDDRPRFDEHIRRVCALRDGEVAEFEHRLRDCGGRWRWFQNRDAVFARDAAGDVSQVIGISFDITERKWAEKFVREQNVVLEGIAKGEPLQDCLEALCLAVEQIDPGLRACMLLSDEQRNCFSTVIAPRLPWLAEAIRGVPAGDQQLGPFAEGIDGGQPLACADIAKDSRWSDEWKSHCQTHGIRAAFSTPIVEAGGPPRGCIVLCFADAKQPTEQDLQVADMAAGLASIILRREQADAALKDADRRKDEFLAMLAHELRNPLAPIHNAVHLLRLLAPKEAALVQARDMIDRQVNHLMRLVDDLLDVSRVSRGKIQLKKLPLDLRAIARQAIETSAPLVATRRHRLVVALPDEPVEVEGDFIRLVQVISNLLNNAAKYTDEGGTIWLSVERIGDDPDEPREAVVRVRDTGRGIDPPALKSLFDLFYQVDQNLDRSDGGLGIGLSLVKRLVEMHGGRVEVHSAGRGRGSEFVVRLCCLTEPVLDFTPQPPSAPEIAAATLRILVVDDNRDSADSLSMLLQIDGHQVWTAYDGRSAVEVAIREQVAVVLLDIGLPLLDGYQACRAIRDRGLTNALVIAMTGYGHPEDQQRSIAAGFDVHLVKPVDFATIRESLAQHPVAVG